MGALPVAQTVTKLPLMQETQVQSLGWEDPLEKGMATHSSILAWRILHGQRSPVGYSPWGHKELDTTERLTQIQKRMPLSLNSQMPGAHLPPAHARQEVAELGSRRQRLPRFAAQPAREILVSEPPPAYLSWEPQPHLLHTTVNVK